MAGSRKKGPINSGTGATLAGVMQNVSGRFVFRDESTGKYRYKEISGELGVPGKVVTHRDKKAQEEVSEGTGEHAGHLIAIEFGAPGDVRNLGLQNPNMNTFAPKLHQQALKGSGGSYRRLEMMWKEMLLQGWKIHATVTDIYRLGEKRPFNRRVRWIETSPSGQTFSNSIDYGGFGSPQQRAADASR